ncbi:hypothetical protein D3C86_2179840 [compost metagenome]
MKYLPAALVILSTVVVILVSAEPSTAGSFAVPSNFTILLAVVPVFKVATPAATVTPEVSASVSN